MTAAPDTDASPADRLRATREKRGLSRNRLAKLVRRAESTVRAHENGQNALSGEMAAAYSSVLGVSASYLLFGEVHALVPETVSGLRRVPVINKIARDVWYSELRQFTAKDLVIPAAGYEGLDLGAYWVSDDSLPFAARGGFVVTADPLAYNWQLGDWIVAEVSGGGRLELAARQLGFDPGREGGAALHGPALSGFEPDHYALPGGPDYQPKYAVRVMGIIVGAFWMADRRHTFGSAVAIAPS